jgi:spermine oxidase
VKLHFIDGSVFSADHVIVTVSLGVLKAGIYESSGMFDPPLPNVKIEAISRLGYGIANKLFLELSPTHDTESEHSKKFPFLLMAFHRLDSEFRNPKIPWWMRKTACIGPIYGKSKVLLSWFAGKEALELEALEDEEIINGVTTTISSLLPNSNSVGTLNGRELKFSKVLKSKWGKDPLFLGSYSYVAVGSSGDDLDTLAMPLPKNTNNGISSSPPLQILFAGEATHRTLYSTTHGAYFSGIREADRLLQHYQCNGV